MEPLEDVPWVLVGVHGSALVAQCQACGASTHGSEAAVNAFADAHAQHTSSSQTHYGMGDLVASTAKMLGLNKPCTPCEQRRQALNNAIPQVPFLRR
jgi:hypothetical protein